MNSTIAATVLTIILSVSAASAGPKDVIERSFNVAPGGTLRMDVDRGPIRIMTDKSENVKVRVTREVKRTSEKKGREILDSHTVTIDQQGNSVEIQTRGPQRGRFFGRDPLSNLQVEYEITLPSQFNFDLHTGGGNLVVSAFQGSFKGSTDGGSITLADGTGDIDANTAGGDLVFGGIQGKVNARTSGGNITIKSVNGPVEAHSSGGSIDISEAMGSVTAHTGGGNVTATFTEQPKSKSLLKTGGGNISVSLPGNVAIDLNARTAGGRIHSDFEGDNGKDHSKLVASLNGGGPGLVLETGGGNVRINRK